MDGGTIHRDGKMRKEEVLSVCMFYGGKTVGEEREGDLISLFYL